MTSTFTWLDYSEHERRKMLDVIELFGERVTRDELGLAGVRDAFADKLFPGTSTIQTRARYFLFIPWLYQILEEKRRKSAEVANQLRKLEVKLIEALSESEENTGVIGIRAKENVRRLASNVYWQGLSSWGMRLYPGSQEEYHRSLDVFYARQRAHEQTSREHDGESLRGQALANWHRGIPPRPENFPDEAAFQLRDIEAEYLRDQILQNCSDSLLAYLVRERIVPESGDFLWEAEIEWPPLLAEWVSHGRNFSELLHGAALLYNLMLAEACRWDERIEHYAGVLEQWRQNLNTRRDELSSWDRQRFWILVAQQNPRIHSRARAFIDGWIDIALLGESSADVTQGSKGRNLIQLREQQLKGGLARLANLRARELWQAAGGAAGADQLDLRWRAARRILSDLAANWEKPHA